MSCLIPISTSPPWWAPPKRVQRVNGWVNTVADGPELFVSPITRASAPVVLGEELRDLGAAVAVRLIRRLGGSIVVDGDTLTIRLPSWPDAGGGDVQLPRTTSTAITAANRADVRVFIASSAPFPFEVAARRVVAHGQLGQDADAEPEPHVGLDHVGVDRLQHDVRLQAPRREGAIDRPARDLALGQHVRKGGHKKKNCGNGHQRRRTCLPSPSRKRVVAQRDEAGCGKSECKEPRDKCVSHGRPRRNHKRWNPHRRHSRR